MDELVKLRDGKDKDPFTDIMIFKTLLSIIDRIYLEPRTCLKHLC